MHDLVPFVQFKKREKPPWRSVDFSEVAGFKPLLKAFTATLLKLTLLLGYFSRFLNCAHRTKSRKALHILKKCNILVYVW